MIAVDQSNFEDAIDNLLENLIPNLNARTKRLEIRDYIQSVLLTRVENCFIFSTGSFPIATYLPESDLDIVLFTRNKTEQGKDIEYLLNVFNALCREIAALEDDNYPVIIYKIRNVEFINARIKLSRCYVNNIGVDITVNQIGSLATLVFLEEADRCVGQNNLFKRSLILIKNWCLHEASTYCGIPLIGSKSGGLTSYAVSIMVLYLFNKFTVNLEHPFSVLRCFLFTFANFNWANFELTLDGPCPISAGRIVPSSEPAPPSFNRFADIQQRVRNALDSSRPDRPKSTQRFSVRLCNIQDPIDNNNNLGISVTAQVLHAMTMALVNGSKHLESMMHLSNTCLHAIPPNGVPFAPTTHYMPTGDTPSELPAFIREFFPHSCESYFGPTQVRADLKEHPLQQYDYHEARSIRAASKPLPNLDGDIDAMWANLRTGVEICGMNEGSFELFIKSQKATPKESKAVDLLPMLPEEEENLSFLQPEHGEGGADILLPVADVVAIPDAAVDLRAIDEPPKMSKKKPKMRNRRKLKTPKTEQNVLNKSFNSDLSVDVSPEDAVVLYSEVTSRDEWDEEDEETVGISSVSSVATRSRSPPLLVRERDASLGTDIADESDEDSAFRDVVRCEAPDSPVMLPESVAVVAESLACDVAETIEPVVVGELSTFHLELLQAQGESRHGIRSIPHKVRSYTMTHLESTPTRRRSRPIEYRDDASEEDNAIKVATREKAQSMLERLGNTRGTSTSLMLYFGTAVAAILFFSVLVVIFYSGLVLAFKSKSAEVGMYRAHYLDPALHLESPPRRYEAFYSKLAPREAPRAEHWVNLGDTLVIGDTAASAEATMQFVNIVWRKDGVDLNNSHSLTYSLTLTTQEDFGEYECFSIVKGKSYLLRRATVQRATPPSFKARPSYSELNIGEPFLVSINAEGNPAPSYQWYKNGMVVAGERSNKLHFTSVEMKHSGTYSCMLENIAGRVMWLEATISVKGPNEDSTVTR